MTTAIPSNYDFSDPAIRDLVDRNHTPCELTVTNVGGSYVELRCEQDHEVWPCPIIQARRAYTEA